MSEKRVQNYVLIEQGDRFFVIYENSHLHDAIKIGYVEKTAGEWVAHVDFIGYCNKFRNLKEPANTKEEALDNVYKTLIEQFKGENLIDRTSRAKEGRLQAIFQTSSTSQNA
ncbi:hypothetical protein J4229_02995 [Candidatus Pacearchaeota archaeon]|nr:hypothetical protein [Candidatus Pacearchaeota archaeon]